MTSIHFQKNALNNAQYHCRESLEVNPVPTSISDEVLESNISKALSPFLRLKKKDTVIVKFKCRKRKRSILINRKNLRNKSDVLTQLKFTGRLFVSESMCHENHKCKQFPRGFGKILLMLNLIKKVNLQRFITLLTLKNSWYWLLFNNLTFDMYCFDYIFCQSFF